MRTTLPALLLASGLLFPAPFFAATPAPEQVSGVEIVRLLEGRKSAEDFDRISEFFTGNENTGGVQILRSQPSVRDGYYFTLRLKCENPVTKAVVEALVYNTVSETPVRHVFEISLRKGSQVVEVGLTGADWPFPKRTHPPAWKLTLRDAADKVLAERKSFLW
jgi:hypothetical protein